MSGELEQQVSSVAGEVSSTPLDAILGGDGGGEGQGSKSPSSPGSDTASQDTPAVASSDDDQVPLRALRAERERRQRMDARVRELEQEIQRFNDQKFDIEAPQSQQPVTPNPTSTDWNQRAVAYNQSCEAFVAKHGKARYDAMEAAVGRLNQLQRAQILNLVETGDGDPVEKIHTYVQRLGMLDVGFHPASLHEALRGEQAQTVDPAQNDRVAELERAVAAAERRAIFGNSLANYIGQNGRENFNQLDQLCDQFAKSGHPAVPEFARTIMSHADPIGVAAHMLNRLGLWPPAESARPQQHRQQVMPSNIVAARNAGSRSGPAWSGPASLNDIFARR